MGANIPARGRPRAWSTLGNTEPRKGSEGDPLARAEVFDPAHR
jgi:hypothetical protein